MSESNEIDPKYQKGQTNVEHRHIDAAGDGHPFGDEAQEFTADLRHLIRKVADDLYETWEATVREYLANAETACLKVEEYLESPESSPYDDMIVRDSYQPRIEVTYNRKENKFIVKDNGIGMAAVEVDEIFRHIGHSAARDDGSKSGQFGMGALSFVKLVGLDSAMLMTSHSRLNDDNAAYYVTLAGVEPIRGSLEDDEYGTKFQMTPKDDFDIRSAVEKYSKWMRVPVKYEEYGEDGSIVFQEDWGDRALFEDYSDTNITIGIREEGAYEAFCSPDATMRTLLLSMDIDRNDGDYSAGQQHGAPFDFDVRLLDESGKVVESSNGNEGLMPINRSDYEQMLIEAREPYITEELLHNNDIIGQVVDEGPNEGSMVVPEEILEGEQPLPMKHDYITREAVHPDDVPGETRVIIGPNEGRTVVDESEWEQMDEGRAKMYVPEDELEDYDLETGEGDLQLPQPTSDRDRLQSHTIFWEYLGQQFAELFDEKVAEVYELINESESGIEAIKNLEPEDMAISKAGFE